MEQEITARADHSIIESFPDGARTDEVTIKILQLSDGKTLNHETGVFDTGTHTGSMTCFNDILWSFSFTPPIAGVYVVDIRNVTRDVQKVQILRAINGMPGEL